MNIHPILDEFISDAKALDKPLSKTKIEELKCTLLQGRPHLMKKYHVTNTKLGEDDELTKNEKKIIGELKNADHILEIVDKGANNPFSVEAEKIYLDLLTDSGTSKHTSTQKKIIEAWEENVPSMHTYSYARPTSRKQLDYVVSDFLGNQFDFYLTTQGRGSEFLLLNSLIKNRILKTGDTILSNRPFDTTKGHIEAVKTKVHACTPLTDPEKFRNTSSVFLGNIDLDVLKDKYNDDVGAFLITVTDNGGGGQPVSMKNYREVVNFAHDKGQLVWLDACRIFENSLFIHIFEKGYQDKSILDISKEMLKQADVVTLSFKKIYSHSGGGILINRDSEFFGEKIRDVALTIKEMTTVVYGNGFDSYCGRTGRDMIEIISGLFMALDPDRIIHRISQPFALGYYLFNEYKLPIVSGGHALYLAADQVLPNVDKINCPAEYLNAILMASTWVRGCGLGNIVYGGRYEENGVCEIMTPCTMDSLRLAIPREAYTTKFMKIMLSAIGIAYHNGIFKNLKGGFKPRDYTNDGFYHFKGKYEPLDIDEYRDIVEKLNGIFKEHLSNHDR